MRFKLRRYRDDRLRIGHASCIRSEGRPLAAERSRRIEPGADGGIVWIDVVGPSPEELRAVETAYGVEFGTLEHGHNIEASARYFVGEGGELHLRNDFLGEPGETAENASVHFVLTEKTLISVHAVELPTFRKVREGAASNPGSFADPEGRAAGDLRNGRRILRGRARRRAPAS